MSNNDIEKIENLNSLKSLQILNLSFNKISKLENISVLKNLEILNLSNNLIEEIPPIIVKNINLTEINLANNFVSEKSSINNLRTLAKLTVLSLLNNPINELQNYPAFIFHALKKLQTLDGRPTPNYSKNQGPGGSSQQVTITLADIPARTPLSTLNDLIASEYQSVEPQSSATGSTKFSYEQRLQATQNRLAELSQLGNQMRFYNASPGRKVDSDGNENKLTESEDSPLINIPKFEPEATYGLGPEKQVEGVDKRYGRSSTGLSEKGVIGRYLKEKTEGQEPKMTEYTPISTVSKKNAHFGDDNSGASFFESDLKLKINHQKDSEATRATTSPQKKFIDFPANPVMQEYYTGLSHQKQASKRDSSDSRDLWSSLAKLTSESEKGIQSRSEENPAMSKERINAYEVMMNGLQPSFGRAGEFYSVENILNYF